MNDRVALYSTVGDELTRYEVDVEGAALARRETVRPKYDVETAGKDHYWMGMVGFG